MALISNSNLGGFQVSIRGEQAWVTQLKEKMGEKSPEGIMALLAQEGFGDIQLVKVRVVIRFIIHFIRIKTYRLNHFIINGFTSDSKENLA